MKKTCACGASFSFIPKEAKKWEYEPNVMWLWECKCGSHLVWPANKESSAQMGKPLMPLEEDYLRSLDTVSDRYKAWRENEMIEQEHEEWWQRNKPDED